jgi:hypothetical protein
MTKKPGDIPKLTEIAITPEVENNLKSERQTN